MTDDNAILIEELQRLFEQQPNIYLEPGVTFEELRASLSMGEGQLRRKIKRLCREGIIEAKRTKRPDVVDKLSYSVVYRPVNHSDAPVV